MGGERTNLSDWEHVLIDYLRPENDVRRRIAERLCELSEARLVCDKCKREEMLTIESSLQYLSHGWPSCCGEDMVFRTGPREKCESR